MSAFTESIVKVAALRRDARSRPRHRCNADVRAQLCVLVKRILPKYCYPPHLQDKATQTVLEQAEVLSEESAVA